MAVSRRHWLLGTTICLALPRLARAQTAPAAAPSFDPTVVAAPHLEPAIPRPAQQAEAARKLAALRARTGRAPNVLIFLVDDMGWGDCGAYGGGMLIGAPTPHIDALAAGGLKLFSCYSQPTCTPSRAAIITGRLPTRSGLTRPILSGERPTANPWADEKTTAAMLSEAGYQTGMSGKWHLGEGDGLNPHQVGYDEYYGILTVTSEMSQQLDQRLYPDLVLRPDRLAAVRAAAPPEITKGRKGGPLEVDRAVDSTAELSMLDQRFAEFSEGFIRRQVQAQKPFYLMHSFARLHNDNFPAPGYAGRSPAGFPHRDAIVETDDIVGRLMAVLRETGQEENTLVFLTSDNGGNEDAWPDGSYQPFRGGKGTTWEGGVRVPGIAYWPGMIKAGRQSDGLFDQCDMFNTPLSIAGIVDRISPDRYIDGVDQAGFLLADDGQSCRDIIFMYSENTLTAARWMEFKVHWRVFLNQAVRRNLDENTLVQVGIAPWVYNLHMDPKEQASQGHLRFEWGIPQVMQRVGRHNATFERFPRKDIGLRQ
ncbi:arylsulfatase [Roseomonas sp. HJA6]|uniref:Arylsulfatase n=1 Tax=Roseomonas alba TaxID=2846776 RepID=A0ABS7AI66_9PROT|nr:arylsulfatase [Neoroseomonas alba]MBW6401745.1 arylsulfatase [Neoroseomonas alba]